MTITAAIYGERLENVIKRLNELLTVPALRETAIAAKLQEELQEFRQRGFLTIAFVGEYSAGKSSLISALTGRRDLAISADIATDKCNEYEWNGVKLIDTPGLWTERKDHDARTYEAIAKADLLVYCLTYSLFDTTTLANFKELAFERNYQSKMLLLVNKMSAEAGDVETRIRHYTVSLKESLAPQDVTQFPLAFCDARDQLDGEDEGDAELAALSRFDLLNDLLNEFIASKGAMARLDTPLRIILSSLDDVTEASTRDEGRDSQEAFLLKKLTGMVTRQRRALSSKVDGEIANLAHSIHKMGAGFAKDIGINQQLEAELDLSQIKIQNLCQKSSEYLEKEIQNAVEQLREEVGKEFESPLMEDFLHNMAPPDKVTAVPSDVADRLKQKVAMFSRIADTLGISANKGLISAAQASKSGLATGIRTVGKWVGFKFRPWQAANWAKNLSNAVPYIGVALSLLSLASDVASEVEEANNEAKIRESKRDLLNHFDNVAESISLDMKKSASAAMNDIYGQVEQILSEMKRAHEQELGTNNEIVRQVGTLRAECEDLLKLVAQAG
ncbi:LeoA/HP0731 family dynamin-like GTPase [Duganella fentianensis]|uniref:GTPase n=1 Tax=Duganella fentianensis TaxID=2692177 RepID=UPI0032B137BF